MTRSALPLLLAALGACHTPQRPQPPVVTPPAGPLPTDARDALAQATARASTIQQLSTVAVARGLTGLPGLSIVVDVVAQRPARLFVAARGFFGPPTDEVWTDGERFLWRSNRPGVTGARGQATPQSLGALLPVALPASQWVGLLMGLPLPTEEPSAVDACPDPPNARCVTLTYPDGPVTLWVGPGGAVVQATLEQRGDTAQVRYGPPDPRLGLPTQLWLSAQGGRSKATLQLQDVRLNGPPPPAALFAPLDGPP